MKLQIPTLVTIITAAILFGGFYYTTAHRLDQVETKMSQLEKKMKRRAKRP